MKKFMALALAGASMLACGQANAALVIEFQGAGTFSQSIWKRGQSTPVSSSSNLDGVFSGNFQTSDFSSSNGDLSYSGSTIQLRVPNSLNPISFFFTVDGLQATAATDGWVALPGTGQITFIDGATYTGNYTTLQGQITSAAYRVYDTPTPGGWRITAAVPEPATWAMMIAGFGLTGATLRRRRRGNVMLPIGLPATQ